MPSSMKSSVWRAYCEAKRKRVASTTHWSSDNARSKCSLMMTYSDSGACEISLPAASSRLVMTFGSS